MVKIFSFPPFAGLLFVSLSLPCLFHGFASLERAGMKYSKGQTVKELDYYVIVRFDDEEFPQWRSAFMDLGCEDILERQKALPFVHHTDIVDPAKTGKRIRRRSEADELVYKASIVAAHLVKAKIPFDTEDSNESFDHEVVRHVHADAGIDCPYDDFTFTVSRVLRQLFVVPVEHPLVAISRAHASQSTSVRSALERILESKMSILSKKSVLRLLKDVSEKVPPMVLAALLEGDQLPKHSCLPLCTLDGTSGAIRMIALHGVPESKDMSLSFVDYSLSLEERSDLLEIRGISCTCPRCRFEGGDEDNLSTSELSDIARCYMATEQVDRAETLYLRIRSLDPNDLDSWHALGAIMLSRQRFLEAQRVWHEAGTLYPSECRKHEGLSLQLEKIAAYEYFTNQGVGESPCDMPVRKYSVGAFVVDVLDRDQCEEVILSAKEAPWTKQRHYAVPTKDVPVHSSPKLLKWFNDWYHNTIVPILATQFEVSPKFYVHDAFVVRYDATSDNSLLPIHTDESSHSFVLALNDDYSGGGTYFYKSDDTIQLQTGQVLCFRGDRVLHGGEVVTRGTRYILAAFLYHDDNIRDGSTSGKRRELASDASKFSKQQKKEFTFGFTGLT